MTAQTPGFTLIELLVVIALIGILSAATLPAFSDFTTSQRLNQAAKNVKADLRSAQNRAISGIKNSSGSGSYAWGIYFGTGDSFYTPFKCPTTEAPNYRRSLENGNCTDDTAISLPNEAIIDNVSHENIAFDAVSGDIYAQGARLTGSPAFIDIRLGSKTRRVKIYPGGKIEE